MGPHNAKRPRRDARTGQSGPSQSQSQSTTQQIPPSAYVQAYESQLIYGQADYARELFSVPRDTGEGSSSSSRGRAGALIKWEGEDEREIWVDRYDIHHLLTSLPPQANPTSDDPPSPTPSSSSSWDSLPSDTEDVWYLSGEEDLAEYDNVKKKRWMEALREERLREREKEDTERKLVEEGKPGWGGDDEIPAPAIHTLMTHTALSLSKSPNPSLLEIRILANHSTDERFSFLRGRYKNTWMKIKRDLAISQGKIKDPGKVLGNLIGGYSSSDEENDEDDDGDTKEEEGGEPIGSPPPPPPEEVPSPPKEEVSQIGDEKVEIKEIDESVEEEKKRQRRLRAEEWKRKRKLEQQ